MIVCGTIILEPVDAPETAPATADCVRTLIPLKDWDITNGVPFGTSIALVTVILDAKSKGRDVLLPSVLSSSLFPLIFTTKTQILKNQIRDLVSNIEVVIQKNLIALKNTLA